ncbi:rano class II histocompatibility antigen, A beta chain-like isoform X2 [Hoplias malabaricus]|uniref:rano class II histocompatibility antigen, A beta chain-like isoform X2 n=1 Tax=Hoplias malabaricus TaxID=27720 RepID=UPI0034630406
MGIVWYAAVAISGTWSVRPRVKLMAEKEPSGGHTAMLVCSAYDFYPPAIDVYWQRDGKRETTATISTDELAEGDWYYQVHSHLEYTPKSGEKISCVVEHASFSEPVVYDWDPSLPESDRNKIAIGASGLVLGIILSAAGFIYYKKKSSGRILVPS